MSVDRAQCSCEILGQGAYSIGGWHKGCAKPRKPCRAFEARKGWLGHTWKSQEKSKGCGHHSESLREQVREEHNGRVSSLKPKTPPNISSGLGIVISCQGNRCMGLPMLPAKGLIQLIDF